jgi:hypothetical protein
MTIEASIKTALASVAGGRVYPDVTPDNKTFPLVIYQQVGGDVLNPLDGADPNMDHARVQFWVWSKTRLEASSVMRQVRVALTSGALKAYAYSAPISQYDDTLKLYGARCDFGIWFTP